MIIKPKFWYCNELGKSTWNRYGVYFSDKFCNFFATNIEKIMFIECNLRASNKVGLSLFEQENNKPMYEIGQTSRLNIAISILPYYTDDIIFCWKTKDGSLVSTIDEDFDEDNVICWIEGLKPKEYWEKAFGKKTNHPFVLKDLPFDLEVIEYGTQMLIQIILSELLNSKKIADSIVNLIENYNEKSLVIDRKNGVIHNSSYEIEGFQINYRIDLGSAGINFLKKVLRLLSKFPEVKKVIFDL